MCIRDSKKTHAGEPGQQGGGYWLWQLPDMPDALSLQIRHFANNGHLDSCEEVSKMVMNNSAPVAEVGKVADSGAQGVLHGFAGLVSDEEDSHRILEH